MRIGKNNRLVIFIILAMCTSLLIAGDVDRVGTSSGDQVKIPVGSRNLAMGGADIATTSNIDAIYWNPAGLAELSSGRVAGLFSNQTLIADISTNYFAMGFNAGFGIIGVSLKSFNIGDIDITTVENMDGTGATYSPTFATGGLTYSRAMTDRINFGITGKLVYESIPQASATVFAIDFGVQYKNVMEFEGLCLGLSVRNIGQDMQYDGSGMLNETETTVESSTTNYDDFTYIPVAESSLPTTMDLGMSYILPLSIGELTLAGDFQHNNLENDQISFGAEMEISDMIFLRAGYGHTMEDEDNEDYGYNVYDGLTLGFGFEYNLQGVNTIFGYSYRSTEYFDGSNNTFTLGFEF